MSLSKINIAVAGATGFTGLDLVYLLSKHPRVKILNLCATRNIGKKISYFDKRIKKKLPKVSHLKDINWKKIDLIFLSLPNGEAQKIIKKTFYKYENLNYIDLSADFRVTNSKIYLKNYKKKHKAKDLIKHSVYSISEFQKKRGLNKFRIISNPGCYPTSIQIPLVPLIIKKLIKLDNIVIDSKSGYSGAGKNFKNKFTHKNLYKSTFAYGIKNHRHVCEIDQEFSKHTNKKVQFTFNPHLLPTFRGILSSIYLNTSNNINSNKIRSTLKKFYRKNRFIKILNINSQIGSGNVLNTNNCEISVCDTRIKGRIVIFSALDNLIKGASGQAVQNMNFLFNFSEKLGLDG